jgi:hypothetical protein
VTLTLPNAEVVYGRCKRLTATGHAAYAQCDPVRRSEGVPCWAAFELANRLASRDDGQRAKRVLQPGQRHPAEPEQWAEGDADRNVDVRPDEGAERLSVDAVSCLGSRPRAAVSRGGIFV